MAIKFTNNASSKLTQALTADATSMHIKAEDVAKFPTLTSDDYCLLTLVGDNGNHEIIKTTAISSDGTCTITRAQDSTTAKAWDIDTRVELRITAEYLNSTADNEEITSSITNIESDITDIKNEINNIVDSIPIDDVTITRSSDGKLQVEDIAIGGDESDLASARGIFNTVAKGAVDFNTLLQQGFFSTSKNNSVNSPGFASRTLVFTDTVTENCSQFSMSTNGVRIACRGIQDDGTFSDWTYYISTATIGDGITVNNGIISVPEYEGATSSSSATSGLVPPATSAERNNFLRGDGTWQQVDLSDYALKTELTKYLPLTGGTVSGTIASSANTILKNTPWPDISITDTSRTKSSTRMIAEILDKNSKRFFGIEVAANQSGERVFQIVGRNRDDSDWFFPFLIREKPDGSCYSTTITPSDTAASREITTAEWVNSKLSNYLPLTGGTMTGSIIHTSGRSSPALINSSGGGEFWIFPPSDTDYKGGFIVRARDSNGNNYDLLGDSSGLLAWHGKHIVRSVGGRTADSAGNVNAPYLPLTGGTLTGNYPTIKKDNTTSGIIINGGTKLDDGASLYLYGKDREGSGWCQIVTRDTNSVGASLVLRPSGDSTWDGSNIVTEKKGSANAVRDLHTFTGDSAGSTTIPSGGTWRYWYLYSITNDFFTGLTSGTIAGGSKLSINQTRYAGFAIRIK